MDEQQQQQPPAPGPDEGFEWAMVEREIALMTAIEADYRKQAEEEAAKGRLI